MSCGVLFDDGTKAVRADAPGLFGMVVNLFPREVSIPLPGGLQIVLVRDRWAKAVAGVAVGCVLGYCLKELMDEYSVRRDNMDVADGEVPVEGAGRRLGGNGNGGRRLWNGGGGGSGGKGGKKTTKRKKK